MVTAFFFGKIETALIARKLKDGKYNSCSKENKVIVNSEVRAVIVKPGRRIILVSMLK